jgi:hypothetical protein
MSPNQHLPILRASSEEFLTQVFLGCIGRASRPAMQDLGCPAIRTIRNGFWAWRRSSPQLTVGRVDAGPPAGPVVDGKRLPRRLLVLPLVCKTSGLVWSRGLDRFAFNWSFSLRSGRFVPTRVPLFLWERREECRTCKTTQQCLF